MNFTKGYGKNQASFIFYSWMQFKQILKSQRVVCVLFYSYTINIKTILWWLFCLFHNLMILLKNIWHCVHWNVLCIEIGTRYRWVVAWVLLRDLKKNWYWTSVLLTSIFCLSCLRTQKWALALQCLEDGTTPMRRQERLPLWCQMSCREDPLMACCCTD